MHRSSWYFYMEDDARLLHVLASGIDELGLSHVVTVEKQVKLLGFVNLLHKWSKVYNLTAIRDKEQMIVYHLLDSLSLVNFVSGPNILDVGTGAGLPGIPVALACPQWKLVLLDSNHKKINFIQHVITVLGITNVLPVWQRVEKFAVDADPFATIVSRAFSSLFDFAQKCDPLVGKNTCMVAMKGRQQQLEGDNLPPGYKITRIQSIVVPRLEAERCLVFMQKM